MSSQLTAQQLDHAISNIEKRVAAKKLEMSACERCRDNAPSLIVAVSMSFRGEGQATDDILTALEILQGASADLFAAKHATATIDLEELELNLKAYQQMRSGVVGASRVIDPFKSNQRH
jgi:hypothetical protein